MACPICGRDYTPGRTAGRCNDCDEWARSVRYMLMSRKARRLIQWTWDLRHDVAQLGGRYQLGAGVHARALDVSRGL